MELGGITIWWTYKINLIALFSPECEVFLEHNTSENNFHFWNPRAYGWRRHQLDKPGAEEYQKYRQADPGKELKVDVVNEILYQPMSGVATPATLTNQKAEFDVSTNQKSVV